MVTVPRRSRPVRENGVRGDCDGGHGAEEVLGLLRSHPGSHLRDLDVPGAEVAHDGERGYRLLALIGQGVVERFADDEGELELVVQGLDGAPSPCSTVRLQRPSPEAARVAARAPRLIADFDKGHYFTS
jgi:hypothetical protein